jgi:hypothetical protein
LPVPHWQVPRLAPGTRAPGWAAVPALPPFLLADGSGPALQQTSVRLAWEESALHVRFDCADRDAWGTFTRRDDPLYLEEAVEVFLAPGDADPARYCEFEVSPRGTLFDAVIDNPDSDRATMRADPGWDCPGLRWEAGTGTVSQDWWATLAIPWAALAPETPLPKVWRANFYRIERPRDGEPEFSAWSPTLTQPADFHQPKRFGRLSLAP